MSPLGSISTAHASPVYTGAWLVIYVAPNLVFMRDPDNVVVSR